MSTVNDFPSSYSGSITPLTENREANALANLVFVPTVLLGFLCLIILCSTPIVGDNPSICSKSLLASIENCDSVIDKYFLFPSSYKTSNAKLDLPLPETPVITVYIPLGIQTLTFFRLCFLTPYALIYFCIQHYITFLFDRYLIIS